MDRFLTFLSQNIFYNFKSFFFFFFFRCNISFKRSRIFENEKQKYRNQLKWSKFPHRKWGGGEGNIKKCVTWAYIALQIVYPKSTSTKNFVREGGIFLKSGFWTISLKFLWKKQDKHFIEFSSSFFENLLKIFCDALLCDFTSCFSNFSLKKRQSQLLETKMRARTSAKRKRKAQAFTFYLTQFASTYLLNSSMNQLFCVHPYEFHSIKCKNLQSWVFLS